MSHPRLLTSLAATVALYFASVASVFAQSAPSPATSLWQVSAGPSWVAIRDVARTGRPVDASPVRWRSDGQAVDLFRQWGTGGRHGLTLSLARSASFRYTSPLGDIATRSGDRYQDGELRYEYRRFLRRGAFATPLDFTVGGQALALATSFTRVVPVDLVSRERVVGTGVALALGAEWRPGRLSTRVHWVNGMRFVRHRERDDVQAQPSSRWGGGWLTDLAVSASWRVSGRTSVVARYTRSGDAMLSNHRTYARSHGAVTLGVRHAR